MKVVYLMTQDLDSPAGVGRIFPLARELSARGHQVTILALHPDYMNLAERRFTRQGVQVRYVSQMHVRKHANQKTYFSSTQLASVVLAATIGLSRAALRTPADILHVAKPHPMNSIAALIARNRQRARLVVDCDDLEVANNRFSSAWQRRLLGVFERRIPKAADAVTTHNDYLRDYFKGMGIAPDKIFDLPNGVDQERFGAIQPSAVQAVRLRYGLTGRQVIGYIGSLSTTSHPLELLLQAFSRIYPHCPDSRLFIVGGGEDYLALQDRAGQLELGPAVIFTGRIQPAEVPAFYAACDMIVDPVEDNLVGKTRLPIKLFESWAAGVPFITADVGDRARVLGDPPAGLLVPPGDPGALAGAIQRLLEQPDLRQALVARAQDRIPSFTWQHIAAEMEARYLALLDR